MFVLVTLNFLFPLEEHPAIIVSWLYLLTFSCEETFNLHSTRHPALSGYMYSQLTASWESDIILYYQNVHLFCNASLWEIGILFGIHWSCYVYKCKKNGPRELLWLWWCVNFFATNIGQKSWILLRKYIEHAPSFQFTRYAPTWAREMKTSLTLRLVQLTR